MNINVLIIREIEMEIKFTPPDSCFNCEFVPTKKNNNDQEIAIENTWLQVILSGVVIGFYVCPECGAISANKEAVENVKKLQEAKNNRIMIPSHKMPIGMGHA